MPGVVRALLGLMVLAALATPADAPAATVSSISLYSEAGDFIGQGRSRVFHPGNAQIGVHAERDEVAAWATGGPYGEGFGFEFAAPPGERLEPRNYVAVQRLPFRDPGHAGMAVTGMNRGCNEIFGRFEVRDIVFDASGAVRRLWIVFHQHCEGDQPAAWGEVRVNAWVPDTAAAMAPSLVRWPPMDAWRPSVAIPVAYVGDAAVTGVSLGGAHPGDFTVEADRCSGRSGPCDLAVRFAPTGVGERTAVLRVVDAAGGVHETALEAFAHGGTTAADIEVLEGDVAGQKGRYSYRPADALFAGRAYPHLGVLFLSGRDDRWWQADFAPSEGEVLRPGTYADPAPLHQAGPDLWVGGSAAYCNPSGGEFTIHEVALMPDGTLRSLDAEFLQRCYDDRRPAHRGTWRFRAGATEPLAPWLSPGPRPRIESPPLDDARTGTEAGTGTGTAPGTGTGTGTGTGAGSDGRGESRVAGTTRRSSRLPAPCRGRVPMRARRVAGTGRADRLLGRRRADLLLGGRGADRLLGGGGADCLSGGPGRDRISGGEGADVLLGGDGNDVLTGGPGRDVLDCGPGRGDRARAGRGDRVRRCERVERA